MKIKFEVQETIDDIASKPKVVEIELNNDELRRMAQRSINGQVAQNWRTHTHVMKVVE